ncbi:MAG: proteasome accessory factor PafA2 family protein, partial [Candidatus Aenigmarchaeota archaeon]|nr:proteasome accessory factor PafA2 family protein [Candidatus Aenigmarchaeota archaeon]MDI6721914.1 proteasome accessory factor PafA2 family protein [Candidatus Aenigmarchaeota archaeon]
GNLDLEYHNINPDEGMFYSMQQSKFVPSLFSENEIMHAAENPPDNIRARIRAELVKRLMGTPGSIELDWDFLAIGPEGRKKEFLIGDRLSKCKKKL